MTIDEYKAKYAKCLALAKEIEEKAAELDRLDDQAFEWNLVYGAGELIAQYKDALEDIDKNPESWTDA